MTVIPVEKFNINRFWEKTPTPLKYILIFSLFLITAYLFISKRMDENYIKEIDQMKIGINATYELINNFEDFRREQDNYNKQILNYLYNLHALVEDLNSTTNRKLDMIISAGGKNSKDIIDKILLLNESFEKLSKAYHQQNIEVPKLEDKKINYQKSEEIKYSIGVKDTYPQY
ncbi:MAG TPA: hypothetical protein P5513_06790 [Candidatus Diapherotrites archaeon]|nr:hypothetical protein [Candidatus Diapherotrites archaeon]